MVVINGSILLGIAIPAAFLLGLLIIVLILWCRRKRLREKKLRKLEDKKALAALQGKIVAHQLQQQQQQQQQQVEKTSPQRFLYPDNINPVFPGVNPERLRTLSAGTLPLPNRPQSTLNNPTAHWHWKPTNHQWKSLPRPAAAAAAAVGRQRDESEFETKEGNIQLENEMEGSPEARVTVTNEYLFEDDETGSALNRYETDYAGDSTAATGINDTMAFLDEQIEFDEPVNNDNFPSIASAVDSLKAKGQYRKASANWSTAAAASEGDSSLSITDYSIFDRGFNIVEIDDPPDRPAAPTSLDQLFKGKREGPTAGATGAMETPAAPGTTAIEGTSKTPGGVSPSFKQQRDLISAFLERQMGSSEKTPGHVTQITPAGPSASGSDTDSKLPRIQVTADDERGSREPSEENSETGQQLEPVKLRRRDTGSSGLQPPAADEEDDAESATSDVELDYERNWYRLTSAHEPQPDYKQDKKHHHRSNSHHRMRQSDLLKTHL